MTTNIADQTRKNPVIAELHRMEPLIVLLSAVQGAESVSLTHFYLHLDQSDLPGIRPALNRDRPYLERDLVRVYFAWEGLSREARNWPRISGLEISSASPLNCLDMETINQVSQLLESLSQQAGILSLPVRPVESVILTRQDLSGWCRIPQIGQKAHYFDFLQFGSGMPEGRSLCGRSAEFFEVEPVHEVVNWMCRGCLKGQAR